MRVNVQDSLTHVFRAFCAWLIFGTLISSAWAADPVVSNISAVQRARTKFVDVIDEVIAINFAFNTVKLDLSPIEKI